MCLPYQDLTCSPLELSVEIWSEVIVPSKINLNSVKMAFTQAQIVKFMKISCF